ncbi:hypothetical protein J2X71_004132 [Rhizobium sp. 1399]|nr:hypothetical protein [Rhizobium sp. 1399]
MLRDNVLSKDVPHIQIIAEQVNLDMQPPLNLLTASVQSLPKCFPSDAELPPLGINLAENFTSHTRRNL